MENLTLKCYISYQKIFINKYNNSEAFEKTKGKGMSFFALSIIYQITIIRPIRIIPDTKRRYLTEIWKKANAIISPTKEKKKAFGINILLITNYRFREISQEDSLEHNGIHRVELTNAT